MSEAAEGFIDRISSFREMPIVSQRSIIGRRRLARVFARKYTDAAEAMIRREQAVIPGFAEAAFTRHEGAFAVYLTTWYEEEFPFFQRQFAGVSAAFAEEIFEVARGEVGAEEVELTQADRYVRDVAENQAGAYTRSSVGQMLKVTEAAEEGEEIAAVNARLQKWSDRRASDVGFGQSIESI